MRIPPADLSRILALDVPVLVVLGERTLPASEVLSLVPGQIIELPKSAEAELELHVNNTPVGWGQAVKVGENFGIRITRIGAPAQRVQALAHPQSRSAA